jgi:hypothetical protein
MLANVLAFSVAAPLQPTVLQSHKGTERINPVSLEVQVKWNGRIIDHQSSIMMLDNCTLDPPLPIAP